MGVVPGRDTVGRPEIVAYTSSPTNDKITTDEVQSSPDTFNKHVFKGHVCGVVVVEVVCDFVVVDDVEAFDFSKAQKQLRCHRSSR